MPDEDEYDDDLGDDDKVKEKPSYVTRAVAARERAGLDRELTPRAARGVDERADDVVEVDDDDDWAQADVPMIEPRMTIKEEHIPAASTQEPEQELLGRGHRIRTKRVQFSPSKVKGQRYTDKEVVFLQAEEDSGSNATISEETVADSEGETESDDFEQFSTRESYFGEVRAKRGTSSRGQKDPGVLNHPRETVSQ